MKTYEVAVAAPVPKTLTYGQPRGFDSEATVSPGMRVLVPLGRRRVTGYLLGPGEDQAGKEGGFAVKPILELLDPEPVFPEVLIPFYRWIADYYHFPLGEVIRTALPGGLVTGSARTIRLTEAGRREIPAAKSRCSGPDFVWVHTLLDKGELTASVTASLRRQSPMQNLLGKWQEKGWILIEEELRRQDFQEKMQTVVSLATDICERIGVGSIRQEEFSDLLEKRCPDLKKSEKKTLSVFWDLWIQTGKTPVHRPEITRQYTGAGKALKSLVERGVLSVEQQRVYRDPLGRQPRYFPRPEQLTPDQELVLAELAPFLRQPCFQPFLLHGVTGCGKTEVYLQAAQQVLNSGRGVLVLVPEIALSSQLEAHFYSRFGDVLAVLHSGLSSGERHDQWQRINQGQARVVVGARSAVFAPLADPGLIIVDEEHEPAYKQEDGLRYSGRDLAILRARFAACPVVLGSATPSVTSYSHAKSGKYRLLQMPSRILGQSLPEVQVVDLGSGKGARPDLLFSDQLISALWENMEKRQQSLLFVNRRGFASFMMCRDCGHIVQCRHCQVSLTLHRSRQKLVCHYCGYSLTTRLVCPACNSAKVEGMGLGSERVEEEVRQVIPHARVARLDSDTASSRNHYLKTLRAVHQHDVDILVGTQMIAKGLHFPGITLVGVVWADSGLGMPDFRASERTFQLLAQVTGRAGRGEHPGRVIIQTYQPHHYSVQCARQHDYKAFYEQEESLRSDLQYPPFSRLVNIRFNAVNETMVRECAEKVGAFLRGIIAQLGLTDVEILGPAPAPLVRIKNRTRWQLLLKGSRPQSLHTLCHRLLEQYKGICAGSVNLGIDVDPESMM
ncbi:MAG: primosomal protein N' [Desulfobulbaceae bacterium]|nr:primosomal protein N' [Desulfobulbaceae bacterium]